MKRLLLAILIAALTASGFQSPGTHPVTGRRIAGVMA